MKLSEKQTLALDVLENSSTTELLYGGGAGSGKSVLGCYWILKTCIKYPDTRALICRNTYKDLKDTTLMTFFWVAQQQGIKPGVHYKYNQQDGRISFINDSIIFLRHLKYEPSDPNFDRLGSLEGTRLFVDEANQCLEKGVDIAQSRLRYNLDKYYLIPKSFLSCNPDQSWIKQRFYQPWKDNVLPPYRMFIPALVTDNPYISKHYIDNLDKLKGTDRERLRKGNWDFQSCPEQLFLPDLVVDVFNNEIMLQKGKNERYLSCDVARFGRDSAVICAWIETKVIEWSVSSSCRITEVVNEIIRLKKKYKIPNKNIVVDDDGVGGGVVDAIPGCVGFVNNSSQVPENKEKKSNYGNYKTQVYFKMQEFFENGDVDFSFDNISHFGKNEKMLSGYEIQQILYDDLMWIRRKDPDKENKIYLIPKDEIKKTLGRSPDFADVVMMRFAFFLKKAKIKTVENINDLRVGLFG